MFHGDSQHGSPLQLKDGACDVAERSEEMDYSLRDSLIVSERVEKIDQSEVDRHGIVDEQLFVLEVLQIVAILLAELVVDGQLIIEQFFIGQFVLVGEVVLVVEVGVFPLQTARSDGRGREGVGRLVVKYERILRVELGEEIAVVLVETVGIRRVQARLRLI